MNKFSDKFRYVVHGALMVHHPSRSGLIGGWWIRLFGLQVRPCRYVIFVSIQITPS